MKILLSQTLEQRAAALSQYFRVIKPVGKGPFPTILMFHGCGRADVPQMPYAEAIAKEGFASIIVDSFAPREINMVEAATMVCTGVLLRAPERIGDVSASLFWALNQDWVDKDNIGAIGWSHGGWTLMDALALEDKIGRYSDIKDCPTNTLEKLKAIFAIYPWCGIGSSSCDKGWQRKIPAHLIISGQDYIAGDVFPKKTVKKLKSDGYDIDYDFFKNATHSFDEIENFNPANQYDEKYLKQAINIFTNFMKEKLKQPHNSVN